jgi:uncharacterized delta-60 repeat protein
MNADHTRSVGRIVRVLLPFAQTHLDHSFNPGSQLVGIDPRPVINSVVVQPDGKVLVAGYFDSYDDGQLHRARHQRAKAFPGDETVGRRGRRSVVRGRHETLARSKAGMNEAEKKRSSVTDGFEASSNRSTDARLFFMRAAISNLVVSLYLALIMVALVWLSSVTRVHAADPPFPAPEGTVWIPPGTFLMGSPDTELERDADESWHTVTLPTGFFMGQHEVTQREYLAVMGNNPSRFNDDLNLPVERVSWHDAIEYCARLTASEREAGQLPDGWVYRLPTESEWEYACRAGTATPFHYGEELRSGMANFDGRNEYVAGSGTVDNSGATWLERTTPVGSFEPNAFGLYDMHGNVWEWCFDWYGEYPHGEAIDPVRWKPSFHGRVQRGGSWFNEAWVCRSAYRYAWAPGNSAHTVGFRVVAGAPLVPPPKRYGPGSVDLSFGTGPVVNRSVRGMAVQPDGKVIVAGTFVTVHGQRRSGVARLHTDGSLDRSFDPGEGTDPNALALALQSDGKVLIGGWFDSVDGVARRGIARLNADGSIDHSFDPGSGTSREVWSISLQDDGRILIGGLFQTVNGQPRNGVARLHPDGRLDESFDPGTGAPGGVLAVAAHPDGKVWIGGWFTQVNGQARTYLARLNADGSLDTGFNPYIVAEAGVWSLLVQPDGKVLVGSDSYSINGYWRDCIARFNAEGSLDIGFDPGRGANGTVMAIALQPNGKVLIGGSFTTYHRSLRSGIARLHPDGRLDEEFDPGMGTAEDGFLTGNDVYAIAPLLDGRVLIGGLFGKVDEADIRRLARLHGDRPHLAIHRDGNQTVVSWPAGWTGFALQERLDLGRSWIEVGPAPVDDGARFSVTVFADDTQRAFRAWKP